MRALILSLMCAALSVPQAAELAARQPAPLPPVPFEDVGACPFEGCVYREWTARPTAGFHRVAFRVDADGFVTFVRRLGDHPLQDHQGRPLTADAVVDHDLAYSIYFCDPYGHRLEVTTYEHDAARAGLR